MPIETSWKNCVRPIVLSAMIDSGATQSFIHKSLVDKYDIPVTQLPQFIALEVADGRPIKSGAITHKTCSVSMCVDNHHEKIDFYVTNIGQHNIILGTSWLKKHNPRINWPDRQVDFSSDFCRTSCLRKQEVSSRTVKSRQSSTSTIAEQNSQPEKSYNQEYASIFDKPLPSSKPSIETIGLRSLRHFIKTRQVTSVVALDLQTGKKLDLNSISSNHNSNQPDPDTPTIGLPEEFSDFADVFSKTSADKLPEHTEYDHRMPLEPGTKPPFGTISLCQLSS
jgi:hypothetical protein